MNLLFGSENKYRGDYPDITVVVWRNADEVLLILSGPRFLKVLSTKTWTHAAFILFSCQSDTFKALQVF